MKPIFSRALNALCAVTVAAVLSACGGASSTVKPLTEKVTPSISGSRIIAFGDALSDAGQSGARYTVNDGAAGGSMTLTERLAANFGFATVTPVHSGVLTSGGAYSYAYGGARVTGGSIMSVADQIDAFVDAGNQLTDNDLVVITAGSQDIVYNATEYYASRMTSTAAKDNIATAAETLVTKVKRLTGEAKAKHVLLIAPFNMARTPWGLSQGANYPSSSSNYTFLEQLSIALEGDNTTGSFGSQLSLQIGKNFPTSSSGLNVFLSDLSNYFNLMTGTGVGYSDVYARAFPHPTGSINTYRSYSTSAGVLLTNPDIPVCTASILLCTASTIATNSAGPNGLWDYSTSVFADDLNLTPAANRMLADYIFNGSGMGTMRTAGWR